VHRDIKPGNVILRPDGSYCLVDFGSVRDRLKPEGGSTVVGTFGFMAPEQFQGRAAPGSDVYAVAATALSLLSGSEPEDLPHKGLGIDVEGALRGQVDRRVIAALRSMLEPDPDRRAHSVEGALRQAGLWNEQPPAAESPARAAKRERQARLDAQGHAADFREDWQDWGERVGKKAERRARKAARKAERRAQRMARWHGPGRPIPPGILLGIAILLAFRVASLATFALFRVLLPTLFTLLGIFGGRRMYERGRHMIEIGRSGQRGLERARQHVRHQFLGGPEPLEHTEPRVAVIDPPARARVRIDPDAEPLEAEAEELAERAERRR
jgi:hypothetical protein